MARLWRAHHPDLPSTAGSEVSLARDEAHHVNRVLRLRAGDRLALFDGSGSEWRATLTASGPDRVTARLDEPETGSVEAPLELHLLQGLCAGERMELVVRKATEVGVASILPFSAARSTGARPSGHKLERWRRIAVEACKQSGRRRVPRVELLDGLPAAGADGPSLLLDPSGPPIGDRLAGPQEVIRLAVGPESGFDAVELASARDAGWIPVGLGPRTLRTETAGLVAAAIVLHRLGDLGRRLV